MAVTIDGTTGITTPGITNTGTDTLVDLTTTGNTVIGNATTDTLVVGVNGIVKDTFGNVGIGVTPSSWTSAGKALQVNGISLFNNTPTSIFGANIYRTTASYIPTYWTNSGGGELAFNVDGAFAWTFSTAPSGTAGTTATLTERMRIDSSGNMGIGTTPSYKLDVSASGGVAAVVDVARIYANASSSAEARLILGSFAMTTNAAIGGQAESSSTGILKFYTATASVLTEKMRIASDGSVGIGTLSPNTKLEVYGGSWRLGTKTGGAYNGGLGGGFNESNNVYSMYFRDRSDTAWNDAWLEAKSIRFRVNGATIDVMQLDSSGNVGIGTTSPNGKLAVIPTANPTTVATSTTLTLGETTNNSAWGLRIAFSYLSSVYTGVIDAVQNNLGAPLTINPTGGNVGIGITVPSKKFEVYTSANSLQIGAIVRNEQAGTGVAAIGFNVSAAAGSEASVTKAGIGLVRQFTYGRGTLTFYNDNSAANNDFTTANAVMSIDATGVLGFNSGYGSVANAYGCRAWVNFNGTTATPSTIRGSGNVTSVTKNGTGDYTINFTTAMPDTNYSVFGCSDGAGAASYMSIYGGATPYTTSSIRIGVTTGTSVDRTYVNVSIFR